MQEIQQVIIHTHLPRGANEKSLRDGELEPNLGTICHPLEGPGILSYLACIIEDNECMWSKPK